MRKNKLIGWLVSLTALLLAVSLPTQAMAITPRISLSLGATTLAPGQTQAVTITLDNPIVCSTNPCEVVLDFSASESLGVTMTPNVVTFTMANWASSQTVTVGLDINTPAQYSQVVNLASTASSNSQYYDAFQVQFPVTLNVPDIRSSATPAPTQSDQTLANTGFPTQIASLGIAAGVVIPLGVLFLIVVNSRRFRSALKR